MRPRSRLSLSRAQGRGRDVNAGGVEAEASAHEHVLAGPAAGVQRPAPDGACVSESAARRPGPPEIPVWLAGGGVLTLARTQGTGTVLRCLRSGRACLPESVGKLVGETHLWLLFVTRSPV